MQQQVAVGVIADGVCLAVADRWLVGGEGCERREHIEDVLVVSAVAAELAAFLNDLDPCATEEFAERLKSLSVSASTPMTASAQAADISQQLFDSHGLPKPTGPTGSQGRVVAWRIREPAAACRPLALPEDPAFLGAWVVNG